MTCFDDYTFKKYIKQQYFNDTSRYLDDIFTIDNPEFEKYFPDIYPAKLKLDKSKHFRQRNFFLGFKY